MNVAVPDRVNYGVQLSRDDRNALEAVARRWQVKPSDVIRITIRALAEANEMQVEVVAPPPDDAPRGTGVADER